MDFSFTEEQNMIRDSLSRLIREQYDWETRNKVITSESGWRPEMWAQFAELGLLMAPFSEEDGGLGGNVDRFFEAGRKQADVPAISESLFKLQQQQ